MNVRSICLAILYDGDATGYEIRKLSVEGEYSYFVDASYGAIYPALARLEQEEFVTSRVEQQDGKPAKKIYSITKTGRATFIQSLFEKLGEDEYRSEFLLFLRFASELPQSLVEQRLNERLAQIDSDLADFDRMKREHNHPGDAWVIDFGRTCMQAARHYIEAHGAELIALARPDRDDAAAAE
ncbi:PadR family transcriptional regulator [Devosia sp. ZB163]|uniref:PadR family transcriptional regulator n=1 Tax=Devosia sp. ZB163 TaxID=3025938 RepID=UPI00236285B5|nr:PadR family transcriptional regulator [Devosia sp. ZB163]MDC9823924.1 PadR family transcriptional regulator [Devosia sp. ZB163]